MLCEGIYLVDSCLGVGIYLRCLLQGLSYVASPSCLCVSYCLTVLISAYTLKSSCLLIAISTETESLLVSVSVCGLIIVWR